MTTDEKLRLHRPDERLERSSAACSLWWKDVPTMPGETIGCLGHYEAEDQATGEELVKDALEVLRRNGCTLAIGPMDGNTWRSYRFVTDPGERPPFLMEPANPPEYPLAFEACGFESLARYSSSIVDLGDLNDMEAVRTRAESRGISFRALDVEHFERDLDLLYEISLAAFPENFLYTSISREEFHQMYAGVKDHLRGDMVQIAEAEGKGVAFCFAMPDWLEMQRTGVVHTMITKTVAVDPEWRRHGLGAYLVKSVQRIGRDLYSLSQAIHALQHESNSSLKITGRSQGKRIRQYTLYNRKLA